MLAGGVLYVGIIVGAKISHTLTGVCVDVRACVVAACLFSGLDGCGGRGDVVHFFPFCLSAFFASLTISGLATFALHFARAACLRNPARLCF